MQEYKFNKYQIGPLFERTYFLQKKRPEKCFISGRNNYVSYLITAAVKLISTRKAGEARAASTQSLAGSLS